MLAWIYCGGTVIGFLAPYISIVVRSMLSKCVTKDELGKIFSLPASIEAGGKEVSNNTLLLYLNFFLVPLLASPIYTFVYTTTLNTFAGKQIIIFI